VQKGEVSIIFSCISSFNTNVRNFSEHFDCDFFFRLNTLLLSNQKQQGAKGNQAVPDHLSFPG
jgi:hypothetical protein